MFFFLQFLFFFFPLSFNSNKKTNAMSGLTRVVSSSDGDDSYEPKVILITGAAGFIGSHTALRLVKNLPNVRVSLSRFLQVFDFQVFRNKQTFCFVILFDRFFNQVITFFEGYLQTFVVNKNKLFI